MLKNSRFGCGILVLLLLLTLVSSGCGSKYEPDELSYVLLIGIDHGAENLLRVSYLIANPQSMAGGEGGGTGGGSDKQTDSPIVTVESPSLYASMNLVNTFIGRKISLMHAKGIIFSEAMARDGSMVKLIRTLLQFRETRGTAFVAVSKEKPEEILKKMKPLLEVNPAKYIELLAATQKYTGFIPSEKLQDFYNELKVEGINPISMVIAESNEKLPPHTGQSEYRTEGSYEAGRLIKKGGVELEAIGAAAFKDDKMVGELNGDETIIYSMFRGKFERSVFSVKDPMDPKSVLSMDVSQARKPRIKVKLLEEGAVIDAKLSLEGNVLGALSTIDYGLPQNRPVLEKAFANKIQKEADALVAKTQQEFKSDIMGFGMKARRLVLTEKEWQELNWPVLYETAVVNVEVDYKIRRTGTIFRTMPSVNSEQGVHEGENLR
ncbi:Ger(x)C family spore germination protein [Desulfolucanica intricata]|uniref:Ger(x)C family spore germination protein n=1 Tax=Desulfolucanica intricata TaxID=1285191 RepID=UPI00082B85DB|nr:Ger(x)C family spore germination protein [Desulfolucanica intricata]